MEDAFTPDSASTVPPGLPLVAPDAVEQELGEAIDNVVPTHGYGLDPMVGIGGSAGAIPSLKAFFERAAPNAGFAFVVILHLSPDHESMMPGLIQQWTTMHVAEPKDGEKVKPNSVYVIPPGKQLLVVDGHFRLADLTREHGRRVAVDLFFRSLADTHGAHAMAVVLPYQTVYDRIAGVVLTLVDITECHLAQEELREKVDELTRFNAVAVGRETRMIELKKELNELCTRLNEPRRYSLAVEPDGANEEGRNRDA